LDVQQLLDIILKTSRRGGTTVIPSFAVGRTQELIYELNNFYDHHPEYQADLENLMVYVDSPMATTTTEVFRKNAQVFDEEMKELITSGDDPLDFKNLKFTRTTDESKQLNMNRVPKVIISASGMCEAGRIRHHLKHNLWDEKSSVIFVGYQAEGTMGRLLLDGTDKVTLFGEEVQVKAEIHNLEGFSGHADRDGLYSWLAGFEKQPKHVFLVHGETESKEGFAEYVKEHLGYEPIVVRGNSEFVLEHDELINKEEALRDAMDSEAIENTKKKIADIHSRLETILYNTSLATGTEMTPEKLAEINNLVMELEKSSVNLGVAVGE
jgi:metallo-beta-lactamase family protein